MTTVPTVGQYFETTLTATRDNNDPSLHVTWTWNTPGLQDPAAIPVYAFEGRPHDSSLQAGQVDWGHLAVIDIHLQTPDGPGRFKTQPLEWVGLVGQPQSIGWTFSDGYLDDQREQLRLLITNPASTLVAPFSLLIAFDDDGTVAMSPDPTIANRKPPPP